MVVPWAAPQRDCEDFESSGGCCGLVGRRLQLPGDIGSDRTKVVTSVNPSRGRNVPRLPCTTSIIPFQTRAPVCEWSRTLGVGCACLPDTRRQLARPWRVPWVRASHPPESFRIAVPRRAYTVAFSQLRTGALSVARAIVGVRHPVHTMTSFPVGTRTFGAIARLSC